AEKDGGKYYTGPSFFDCRHPATWLTDIISNPSGKGRSVVVLREHVKELWAYVQEADVFVHRHIGLVRTEAVLNKTLAPFSDTVEVSKLLVKAYAGWTVKLAYRPDMPTGVITQSGQAAINLHRPSDIRAIEGDPAPFLDFMQYMFKNPRERKEV